MRKEISSFYWFWIPVVFMVVQIFLEIFVNSVFLSRLLSENGPYELLQAGFMVAAFFIAASYFFSGSYKTPILTFWFGLAAICCFYVAGEELSWGQQVWHWSTPEYWAHINDQGETNLHNISSWFDQKPRLVLLIGIIVGGLIIPVFQRFKPDALPTKFSIIYPPAILGVSAAFALGVNLLDKISELLSGKSLLVRGSEIEELYLFYFVLLYLVILRRRVVRNQT